MRRVRRMKRERRSERRGQQRRRREDSVGTNAPINMLTLSKHVFIHLK
jgi:hypothetical protein